MEEEAKNIIKDHKNPLTKMSLIGKKYFLKDTSEEAQENIAKNLENLEKVLTYQKVEKRSGRAKADWHDSLNLAKVNKVVKGLLEHFGYQDKSGIYMYPEEMLFLVETNRMEMFLNEVPLSIQECFDIVLNTPDFNLSKYRIYKKLVSQGYRVIRYSEIMRRKGNKKVEETENFNNKKRKLEETENKASESKKYKPESATVKNGLKQYEDNGKYEQMKKEINKCYEEIRKNSPQSYVYDGTEDPPPDFCLFNSSNTSRVNWDSNLYICKNYALDELKTDRPSMYAICSGDNISFYKIGTVNLPCNVYE